MSQAKTYFAAEDPDNLCKELWARVDSYATSQVTTAMFMRAALAFRFYFGFDPSGIHGTSGVLRGGEQGEIAEIRVNHSRALVGTLLNLIVNSKLCWSPRATNRDNDAIKQTELAQALLEYYWTDKQVGKFVTQAVEEAIAFCEGFVLCTWEDDEGEDATVDPDAGRIIKQGDLVFRNLSTWDVIRDPHKHSYNELNWVICRIYRNKFDLAAKYPDMAEKILAIPIDLKALLFRTSVVKVESDDIPVYFFWHKKTPALPEGREAIFASGECLLEEGPLSYDGLPLHRVSPGELISTPYGYSAYMEILGMQEVLDSVHSSITTNLTTFGTQAIVMEQGSEVPIDQLAGGMRAIYVPPSGRPVDEKVKALQLTAIPAAAFTYAEKLKEDMELLMGLNSVVRGTTPGGPKEMSGSAMALLQSQALQQSSVLQGSYVRLVENLGTSVIRILRKRATAERKIAIAGKSNQYLVQDQIFTGADLDRVDQVKVDAGNPLSQTGAGRAQIAEQLINMKQVTTPEQYQQVLSTGRLEPLTHAIQDELMQILAENEQISQGIVPQVMMHDNHLLHCKEHRCPATSPNSRADPSVVNADIQHIHAHYQAYYGVPPMVPPPPPMVPPGMPPPPPPTNPDGSPVLVPEPLYRPRMQWLTGMTPPPPELQNPPPMPPPGPPPGPPGRPMGPPKPEGSPPPELPNGKKLPNQPNLPRQPATGERWNPQSGGGMVAPPPPASPA